MEKNRRNPKGCGIKATPTKKEENKMRFSIMKDIHGIVTCIEVKFGLDDSASYLAGTRYFNDVTKSWIPVFYNLEKTYKVLENMAVGQKITRDFGYDGISLGELDFLQITRIE